MGPNENPSRKPAPLSRPARTAFIRGAGSKVIIRRGRKTFTEKQNAHSRLPGVITPFLVVSSGSTKYLTMVTMRWENFKCCHSCRMAVRGVLRENRAPFLGVASKNAARVRASNLRSPRYYDRWRVRQIIRRRAWSVLRKTTAAPQIILGRSDSFSQRDGLWRFRREVLIQLFANNQWFLRGVYAGRRGRVFSCAASIESTKSGGADGKID